MFWEGEEERWVVVEGDYSEWKGKVDGVEGWEGGGVSEGLEVRYGWFVRLWVLKQPGHHQVDF